MLSSPGVWQGQKVEAGPSSHFAPHQTQCGHILATPGEMILLYMRKRGHAFIPNLSWLLPDTPKRILWLPIKTTAQSSLPANALAPLHLHLSFSCESNNLNQGSDFLHLHLTKISNETLAISYAFKILVCFKTTLLEEFRKRRKEIVYDFA